MNITVHYQPTAKELARASSLFIEKKPFFLFTVGFLNIFTGLFLAIFALKLFYIGLFRNEWFAAIGCALWLFGRKPFNEWLLYQRMKNSLVMEKPITIEISLNGIVWSGKGLLPGNMSWEHVKYVLEAKNGYILPNSITKFLWLPHRGFQSPEDLNAFKQLIMEKKLVYRVFSKWVC